MIQLVFLSTTCIFLQVGDVASQEEQLESVDLPLGCLRRYALWQHLPVLLPEKLVLNLFLFKVPLLIITCLQNLSEWCWVSSPLRLEDQEAHLMVLFSLLLLYLLRSMPLLRIFAIRYYLRSCRLDELLGQGEYVCVPKVDPKT